MVEHKIVIVRLTGGILGALAGRPHVRLERQLQYEAEAGWEVTQVLPEAGSSGLLRLLYLLILVCTLLLWAPEPGYMVVMKRG